MNDLIIRTLDATRTLPEETLAALKGRLRGAVALPGEDGYDAARTIWNAMVDRRPAVVARCLGAADVIEAVKLARDQNLLVAVRAGGHNIAGNAVCDGGLMIDLSLMKSVRVDPVSRTARVEPGATLADFDREAQAFGLMTPLGINSTTGVAGLTLGGGFGWTTRKFGLTVDNLLSADVVTSDGEFMRASETEHPDLFWALRGGGGNFGVVTSFEFKLHPLGPQVLSGLVVHPFDEATRLLPEFRRLANEAPDELTIWAVMRKAPPLPFLPGRMARQGSPDLCRLLQRRHGGGREGDPGFARARQADRRRHFASPIRRLANGVRSAPDRRRAQLLEEPRLRRSLGRGDRGDRPRRPHAAVARMRGVHRPCRGCDGARRPGRHGVVEPQGAFHHERAYPLARQGSGFRLASPGLAACTKPPRPSPPAASTSISCPKTSPAGSRTPTARTFRGCPRSSAATIPTTGSA